MSVCPSVRPSHAGMCVNDYTYPQRFSTVGYHQHTSFSIPKWMAIFRRGPPNGGAEYKGPGRYEKSRYSTNMGTYFGTDARQSHSYYGRRIGNRTQAVECYHFEWLEWPLTQVSRSWYHSTSNNSKTVPDRAILTMADQQKVVYGLSNGRPHFQ